MPMLPKQFYSVISNGKTQHYMLYGQFARRNPSSKFIALSSSDNIDVAMKVPALEHYLQRIT